MKNKYEFKKFLKNSLLVLIICSIVFLVIEKIEYKVYTENFNNKINSIVIVLKNNYPDITEDEIMEVINSTTYDEDIFKKYGIDIETDSILEENDRYNNIFAISNMLYIIIMVFAILLLFIKYNNKKDKDIANITKCIEQINKKNYKIDLDDMSEDELSILKSEIYKTTIMLKEQAENSLNDKVKLKDSLSDISHQLKTPLTSIMIMLDNIIDNPDMDKDIKDDFIKDIKTEIASINFLVQSILKLSQFDSNTIKFTKEKVLVSDLIDEAIKKLLPLCDLKNIEICVTVNNKDTIICDKKWQIEALTNLIKNAVEHSKDGGKVEICEEQNNAYTEIKIIDYGTGIDKEDLKHIFERFYKGKNSSESSIGIGLALSKTIVEANDGIIEVESELSKGTCFKVKYFII